MSQEECRNRNLIWNGSRVCEPVDKGFTNRLNCIELQQQYTNYKNSLQQLAQKIGDIEQDAEEHKYVFGNVSTVYCNQFYYLLFFPKQVIDECFS